MESLKDLERVEMGVLDAQREMKSIKKQHLGKVKSRAILPPRRKMALESAGIPRGESRLIDGKGCWDIPLRQELRALDEATAIRKTKTGKNPHVQREVTGKTKA